MNRNLVALAFIAAFSAVARLVYLARIQYFFWDEAVYLSMADALSGNFYSFEFFRPPLWPLLLSAVPKTLFAAKALSFVIALAGIPVIFWLSRRSLDERKSLLVTFFYAFNHLSLFYSGLGATESLSVLLLFVSLLSFHKARGSSDMRYWVLSGAALGLAAMTKHTAAFMIFPIIAYLLIDRKGFRLRGFLGLILAAAVVLSPWLVSMQVLFGNPLYPQLENIGTSTRESPLFYAWGMPLFLGIQGLLIPFSLLLVRRDRFVLLGALVLALGTLLLSMVGHKELRYLIVLVPGVACLEAMGMHYLAGRIPRLSPWVPRLLVASGAAAAVYLMISVPVMPRDQGLDDCISFAEPYYTAKTMSSPATFFAFSYKSGAMQVHMEPGEASCGLLEEIGADHVIIYEDWEFEQAREKFMEELGPCLREFKKEGNCVVFRVVKQALPSASVSSA